jgi:hypothetical protein
MLDNEQASTSSCPVTEEYREAAQDMAKISKTLRQNTFLSEQLSENAGYGVFHSRYAGIVLRGRRRNSIHMATVTPSTIHG